MHPSKRTKIEIPEEKLNSCRSLMDELEQLKYELEPVERKHKTRSSTESYCPSQRAVLAHKGMVVKETIGSGSYSKVKLVFCMGEGECVKKLAVKIIDRLKAPNDFQQRFLPRELSIWPRMVHPNIVRMRRMFEEHNRVYMVLDYAENGDALRFIQKSGAITERLARIWMRQVCDAVRYLHEQNISHRDLKLENLLLDSKFNLKICDFGFVKKDCMKDLSKTYCGSKSYASPEILRGEPYDPKKSDVWALGVILYILLTGKMPFDESKGNQGVLEEQRKLNFPWHRFRNMSEEGRDFILKLFNPSYIDRPDIHAVIRESWMGGNLEEVNGNASTSTVSLQNDDKPEVLREFTAAFMKSANKQR